MIKKPVITFTTMLLLLSNITYSLSLDTNVDYWHNPTKSTSKKEQNINSKHREKPKSSITINIQQALTKLQDPNARNEPQYREYIKILANNIKQVPTSELEKLPESVMLDVSKYQYENHIKATKPLVAYLYLKDPDKYKNAFWDWYTWKTQQVGMLTNNIESMASLNSKMLTSQTALVKWFNDHNIGFLFFCKTDNNYCQATMSAIKEMQSLGLHVNSIDVSTRPDLASEWNINTVPTIIALNPNNHTAVEYKGAFNMVQPMLYYFYQTFKERDNPLLHGG
ncbi:MAG: conjugal transfer protein TraF [Candidatus Nanopusillus acidilobi]